MFYPIFRQAALLASGLVFSVAALAAEPELHGKYVGMTFKERVEALLKTCPGTFAKINARVEEAEVADPQYKTVPGYPFLRTSRLMSHLAAHADNPDEVAQLLSSLRWNANFAREIELLNMGVPTSERREILRELHMCSVWQSMSAESDPMLLTPLLQAIANAPPEVQNQGPAPDPAPLPEPAAGAELLRWAPPQNPKLLGEAEWVFAHWDTLRRDVLGRVGMAPTQWHALAAYYAPTWVIETTGKQDRLGEPLVRDDAGVIDRSQAVVHFQPSYALIDGQSLIQLQYFLWFGGAEGGLNDGLIWRVTLDNDGEPLVYESLDMSGGEHLWFPAQPLKVAEGAEPLVPQEEPVTENPLQVRLVAGSHRVRQVSADQNHGEGDPLHYQLRPYEAVFTLKTADGNTHSLFAPNGRVRGTAVHDDGGLRHLSELSLAPREPWYFDHPALLANTFVLPASAVRTASEGSGEQKEGRVN